MLSYCTSAGNVFTTLLFSSRPHPFSFQDRGMQEREDSCMCLSMVCETASDVASHAANIFRSIYWFLDIFRSICWFWINVSDNVSYYAIKGTTEIWEKVQRSHIRPLVIRSSSVTVLCWCGQLTRLRPGFEWPTFLKRAGQESSFTHAFWSFSRECIYQ